MRATASLSILALTGLAALSTAYAQANKAAKAPPANEIRYFTYLSGLADDRADVILKETRQSGKLTAATLDVCFPVPGRSERTDRFVLNLSVTGEKLAGKTQSQDDKLPITVDLTRKPNGKTFDFTGMVTIGDTMSEIASSETADTSEKEFQEQQASDDTIVSAPDDFTEVSPEALAVKVTREAVADFAKGLRGQPVQVALYGLIASCAELRSGEQVLHLTVDPERAQDTLTKLRGHPGVIAAGWTDGTMDMERTLRFPAAGWREGGKLNRDKIANAVATALAKALPATLISSAWNDVTGELKISLKRPSAVVPALGLTEAITVTALAAADKPGGSDHLLLWVGSPSIETVDESAGPKLNIDENASGNDEESLSLNDNQTLNALTQAFDAQRWDAETSSWK
jgi:hypothetical protein